jgi:hypothetical protein
MQSDDTFDSTEYEQGFEHGHDDACDFIDHHPQGTPWAALPDGDDNTEPTDDYERGSRDGWRARMRIEGWPLSRSEVVESLEEERTQSE